MRAIALALIVALGLSSATADVYFEVTEHGQSPDGLETHFPFFYTSFFDVYAWGSGQDTSLRLAEFDVRYTDIYSTGQIQFYTLGTVDSGNCLPVPRARALFSPTASTMCWSARLPAPACPCRRGSATPCSAESPTYALQS